MNTSDAIFDQLLEKSREAANGHRDALSTGERVAAALVLNRADWLAEDGYSLVEAIERVGPSWMARVPAVAKQLSTEHVRARDEAQTQALKARAAALLPERIVGDDDVELVAEFRTFGFAPGYRDISLLFNLRPLDDRHAPQTPVSIRIRPEDAEPIIDALIETHSLAWRKDSPLDMRPGEIRPHWING